ncbi:MULTISPECIES: polysialyltransferase family glycosyltransferase [unclassified Vibrio]|uniref:polysialyltransferase family glycosyltransferase n=1 Tax=unclassified Vibrio TaxID=2614977 RepID=UPI00354B7118
MNHIYISTIGHLSHAKAMILSNDESLSEYKIFVMLGNNLEYFDTIRLSAARLGFNHCENIPISKHNRKNRKSNLDLISSTMPASSTSKVCVCAYVGIFEEIISLAHSKRIVTCLFEEGIGSYILSESHVYKPFKAMLLYIFKCFQLVAIFPLYWMYHSIKLAFKMLRRLKRDFRMNMNYLPLELKEGLLSAANFKKYKRVMVVDELYSSFPDLMLKNFSAEKVKKVDIKLAFKPSILEVELLKDSNYNDLCSESVIYVSQGITGASLFSEADFLNKLSAIEKGPLYVRLHPKTTEVRAEELGELINSDVILLDSKIKIPLETIIMIYTPRKLISQFSSTLFYCKQISKNIEVELTDSLCISEGGLLGLYTYTNKELLASLLKKSERDCG